MTEQNKNLEKKENTKKPTIKKVENKPKSNAFPVFLSLLFFVLTSAVLAFAYYWYQPKINQLNSNVTQLKSQLNQLKQTDKQNYLANQIQQLNIKFNQLDTNTKKTVTQINDTIQKINQQVFLNKQDWLYADIHYLLKLAVRRVDLVGDSKGAIAALEAADKQIKKVENSALLDIRKTIFNTIKKLQSANEPDTEQLILKINHIKNLIVSNKTRQQKTSNNNINTNLDAPSTNDITQTKQSIYQFFSQFFTIKNATTTQAAKEPSTTNLSTKEQPKSYELILYVEKVKHAILTMNQEKFDFYIKKLYQSINKPESNLALKSETKQLMSQQVGISLPSANPPLKRYELYLEKRQQELQGAFK